MNRNIGTADKVLRYVVAIVIFGLGLYFKSWWGLVGLIPLAVAVSGWCPPYAMLGINTCHAAGASNEPPAAQPPAFEAQAVEPPADETQSDETETDKSSEI